MYLASFYFSQEGKQEKDGLKNHLDFDLLWAYITEGSICLVKWKWSKCKKIDVNSTKIKLTSQTMYSATGHQV